MDQKNFEIRMSEVEKLLKDIGKRINNQMPLGFGFTLMIFSYDEGGPMFYLSSAMREDMLKVLDEFKRKLS